MRAAVPFCQYITNDSDFRKKMSLARRRGSVRALYQTDAGPFACIRPEDSTSCFDVPENALALAAFIWCPVIARIMGVDRRPIARNDDVGSTQMQFALAA